MVTTTQQFPLLTRSFDTIVADQTATLASSLSINNELFDTLDLSPGSIMLALIESNAGIAMFMQQLAYRVLRATRLATSEKDDLDSFGADFLFSRYPATPASGQVLFTRSTAATTLSIPINTVVKTNDGVVSFVVIAPQSDPTNQFDPAVGYTMLPNVYTISVLVQAVTPGTIGNIPANTLTKLATSNLSVRSVTNPSSFFNGANAASDDQYRSAFALWIKSRDNATFAAFENAIKTTNPSYTYSIQENYIAAEVPQPGAVLIYFDDGTGFVSQQRQIELQNAIETVRGAAINAFVIAAAPGSLIVECQTNFPTSSIRLANIGVLHDAIANYINSLKVGQNLLVTKLYQVMYDACPAMTEVYNLNLSAVGQDGVELPKNGIGDIIVDVGRVLRFLPNPPIVNGQAAIRPSIIVID